MTARNVVEPRTPRSPQTPTRRPVEGRQVFPYDPAAVADVIGDVPTPEFAAMMLEQCQGLLAQLADLEVEALASAEPEGWPHDGAGRAIRCLSEN